jgi:hypothetical protein
MAESLNGLHADRLHFPLQPLPPPPLWASPLFPPPEGYHPVGVEEEQQCAHVHFAQRVKMLRMQAASAAAAGNPAGHACSDAYADEDADSMQWYATDDGADSTAGQHGQHSMVQHGMQEERSSPRMGLMPPAPPAGNSDRSSLPARPQHQHQQMLSEQHKQQDSVQEQPEEVRRADVKQPVTVAGLSVKTKANWSPDSPASSKGDAIKAFFQVGAVG